MKILLLIGGLHSLFFAVFHCMFWKELKWKTQLQKISATNRAVMEILNLRIIFIFGFHAAICFIFPDEMLTSTLGKVGLMGAGLFWLGRTIEQVIYRKLMPEKGAIDIALWVLFVVGTLIYAVVFGMSL